MYVAFLAGITMPANIAAHVGTHLETFSRMQPTGQTLAVVDSVAQKQTCAIKKRINNPQHPISAVAALASRHLLKSTSLVAKRKQSGEIIDNIGGVAAIVSQKILD